MPLIDKPKGSPSLPPLSTILPLVPEYDRPPCARGLCVTTPSTPGECTQIHRKRFVVPVSVPRVNFNIGSHDNFFLNSCKSHHASSGSAHTTLPVTDWNSKVVTDTFTFLNNDPASTPSQSLWRRQLHADRNVRSTTTKVASRIRKRSEEPEKGCLACSATETPEWRRGPTGPRTLCNACGLFFAKQVSFVSFSR